MTDSASIGRSIAVYESEADSTLHSHYANTDLEVTAAGEPTHLKAVFTQHQFFDRWEGTLEDGQWRGSYEAFEQFDEPDACIDWFLQVIEGLQGPALGEWRACTRRVFDIGYHAGFAPQYVSQELSSETLRRVVEIGATLRITVYGVEKQDKARPLVG